MLLFLIDNAPDTPVNMHYLVSSWIDYILAILFCIESGIIIIEEKQKYVALQFHSDIVLADFAFYGGDDGFILKNLLHFGAGIKKLAYANSSSSEECDIADIDLIPHDTKEAGGSNVPD